jgi:hypothetical protein
MLEIQQERVASSESSEPQPNKKLNLSNLKFEEFPRRLAGTNMHKCGEISKEPSNV